MDFTHMNYPHKCSLEINEAVCMLWSGELTYLGLYGLCEQSSLSLTALAEFWRLSALRLRCNASRMINYHTTRGAQLQADICIQPLVEIPTNVTLENVWQLFEVALTVELQIDKFTNLKYRPQFIIEDLRKPIPVQHLKSICETAKIDNDPETEDHIAACFLHRQTRTIKYIKNHLISLRSVGNPHLYDRLVMRPLVSQMCEHIAVKKTALVEEAGILGPHGITASELLRKILLTSTTAVSEHRCARPAEVSE
ncbi:ferritin heavy chain [Paragonimus westermani]|uniref:ferroxidase n=1 Tax=Paragonimus westermani TaxID=34504 RepID=A0A5J4NS92_9TREM|nr:ferritin heavy chain [Paragonimus westermani]